MLITSTTEMIGGTPLLKLSRLIEKDNLIADLYAKVEFLNPSGSVKDRAALEMVLDAEEKGLLAPGGTILEATSGNTGIGLALVAAARGYKAVIVMPDTMSKERILLMQAYGAQVVLSDGSRGMAGTLEKAEEIRRSVPGCFVAGQFTNPANVAAHYKTTGPEVWQDMNGDIDIFVAGVGTGGTLTGTGKYLKEKNPSLRIVAVEPADSPLLSKGTAGAHGLQGIGANFVPEILDRSLIDEIMTITTEEAYTASRQMGQCEGIMVGISSGAACAAAKKLALREENRGKKIVVLLPDSGDRYLSTGLFGE